jgi:ABC-type methionine transport system ATPase subunit
VSDAHRPAGEIRFVDVHRTRHAAGTAAQEVLRGVSLAIAAGQSVGVIGRSGGGKTTLLRLLTRLEDPDQGALFYGGQDLRALDATTLATIAGTLLLVRRSFTPAHQLKME